MISYRRMTKHTKRIKRSSRTLRNQKKRKQTRRQKYKGGSYEVVGMLSNYFAGPLFGGFTPPKISR